MDNIIISNIINNNTIYPLFFKEIDFFKEVIKFICNYAISERRITIRIIRISNPFETFQVIKNYKYVVFNSTVYTIYKVSNIDYSTGSVEIDIETFDERNLAYNSLIYGYVMLDFGLHNNGNFDMLFFNKIIENDLTINKTFTMNDYENNAQIIYDNNTINLDNNVLISESNTFIKGDLSIINNGLKIKGLSNGDVMIENTNLNNNLYIGNSNLRIDKYGNLVTNGQVSSPYFAGQSINNSNQNLISNLLSRLSNLEVLVQNILNSH
jgi:hypothetical protein